MINSLTQYYEGGSCISMDVIEITEIPEWNLISGTVEDASVRIQSLCLQIISNIYKRHSNETISIELALRSVPTDNQVYKAQVHIYLIVRKISSNADEGEVLVGNITKGIMRSLFDYGYTSKKISILPPDNFLFLNKDNNNQIYSVSRREKQMDIGYMSVYYTDCFQSKIDSSLTEIINLLSQRPNCGVSIQVIPTKINQYEGYAIEGMRNWFNQMQAQSHLFRLGNEDKNIEEAREAYNYYSTSVNDEMFLFAILAYGDHSSAGELAGLVSFSIENIQIEKASGLEIQDITQWVEKSECEIFNSPWVINDLLINNAREWGFWHEENAPVALKRMKQLMNSRELSGVFKLPIYDDRIVGLSVNKMPAVREKLHEGIIADDSFSMGVLKSGEGKEIDIGVPLNDLTKHGLIVGMPGSGKTNFSLGMLLRLWKDHNIPFIAIEPTKTEYRSLIDAIDELQIFTPGKTKVSPFIINPFIPPKGVAVEAYVSSLSSAFKAAFSMPNPLGDIFTSAISDCYTEYGWMMDSCFGDSGTEPFGLYEFIQLFKEKVNHLGYKGDIKANIESAGVVRLTSLIEQNGNIYDSINSIPIEKLLEKPTIIELNAINDKDHKSLIIALLLIMICVYTKNNIQGDGALKSVLLIDEAHVLLDVGNQGGDEGVDSRGKTVETVEDMIAEIRSYGTGIIIADQSPTKVGKNIVANTNVKMIFKLVEKNNRDIIRAAVNMDNHEYDAMGKLKVGEAFFNHEKLDEPLLIHTYDVNKITPIRSVIADDEIKTRNTFWNNNKKLLVPHRECKYCTQCKNNCDLDIRVKADFVSSRIISTYLHRINEKKDLAAFMVRIDGMIKEMTSEIGLDYNESDYVRFVNCVKVKFFRKATLKKNFKLTKKERNTILTHPNVFKS